MASTNSGGGGAPVKDQRFQKVHNDPRFARNSKRKNKLEIDQRFAGVFKDARFQTGAGKYDKYGRRITQQSNELKKFYHLEDNDKAASDDDDDDNAPAKATASSASSDNDDDDVAPDATIAKNDAKLTRLEVLNRMARGELADDNSSSSSESDSDDDSDADSESEDEREQEDVPMGDATHRFAVQSCDWSRIRAVDLFALCQSFAPATGAVQSVTIYPSDYGLQKMKEEEQFGPRGLWNDDAAAKEAVADDDDASDKEGDKEDASEEDADEDDDAYDSDDPLGVKQRVDAATENGFDSDKLRQYELQKLKYYYAIVVCDSVATASAIVDQCDQLEYETSANVLDLRFVPDDVAFTNKPKDSCGSLPESYKPALFATTALQNTDVTLTWEADDDNRMELLTRQSEWKTTDDNDFSAYLASDNSSDEEEEVEEVEEEEEEEENEKDEKKKGTKLAKLKSRYRKMLLGSDAEDESDEEEKEEEESEEEKQDDGDMEMSFTPGASDILKAKKQREREANETPFERYAREKNAQKNAKLHEKRTRAKQRAREQQEVLKAKGRGGANQATLLREAIAEGGEEDVGGEEERGFDLKAIHKRDKIQTLKGKRKAKEMAKLAKRHANSGALQEGFAFDAVDPRFSALYATGTQFQLDPTDPKFKQTNATQAIFSERRKRTEASGSDGRHHAKKEAQEAQAPAAKGELHAMVENLKRKSQTTQHKTKKHGPKKQRN